MDTSATARPVALLEREHEVEQIRAALRGAGRGRGGALIIEAAPGIGKSRLLGESRQLAGAMGLRVLDARSTALEQGFPFGVVRQLFERVLLEAESGDRERWLAGAGGLAMEVLTGMPAAGPGPGPSGGDFGYAWLHGLYWFASNLAVDAPLALVVDDLQWCDAPSARALAYIARRLDGQPLVLVIATRPLDPALMPEAAALVADALSEVVRPAPLTPAAVRELIADRLLADTDHRFVRACIEVTGGNPFLLGELLDEAAARGLEPTSSGAAEVASIVPRGVTNAVLLRLARLEPTAAVLARALSVLDDGAHVGDATQLARLARAETETAMAALVSAGVVEAGETVRFTHPILRTAVYGDLSPAERERLHHSAAAILRERGAPRGQVAAHVMQTEPASDPNAVALLRQVAHDALALGDADRAAALLSRALDEPPADGDRPAILLELGQALAHAGAPQAIAPLSEIAERGEDPVAVAAAAIDLSSLLFFTPAAPLRERRSCAAPGSGFRPGSPLGGSSRSRCWASAPLRRRRGGRRRRRSPPCETRAARHATCCRRRRLPRSPWRRC
ncbi:MAG: hypothetical protein E6G41_01255 [Actinobacteria bacterium]|nr:MAG: hypothetical protein E6G41_01255 [Actinomycetota bacterium]